MKRPLCIAAITFSSCIAALAADQAKVRKLDALESVDPTRKISNLTAKAVQTPDKNHSKVVELIFDYSQPGVRCGIGKDYEEGVLNPKKYSGFQFWARSNNETSFDVGVAGSYKRSDQKKTGFTGGGFKATPEWKQYVIPFEKLKRNGETRWEKGKQVKIEGGDPPDAEDFSHIKRIGFGSHVGMRGNDGTGHLMIHMLELIEK